MLGEPTISITQIPCPMALMAKFSKNFSFNQSINFHDSTIIMPSQI